MVKTAKKTNRAPEIQYGALPWRRTKRGLEVLVVTTLTTRRWVVPKGWPLKNCTPTECAAYEAFEEAGVIGTVARKALGKFLYDKRRKSGKLIPCEVEVFPMEVVTQRRKWAERGKRELRWCSCAEAASLVSDAGLKHLIAEFGWLMSEQRTVPTPI